jgi:hypothetical protein
MEGGEIRRILRGYEGSWDLFTVVILGVWCCLPCRRCGAAVDGSVSL